jgi:putative SOS response-associated peptidase YedK
MISRYSLSSEAATVSARFSVDPTESYLPKYNAAPTHLLPVITQESPGGLSYFYWGAPPSWANRKPLGERLINAHAERFGEKGALRKKLLTHRCLVPADGFFIWKRAGKKASIPYLFTLPDKSLFAMAGLWEEFEDENGTPHHTFTLVTTPSGASVADFSERMPALVTRENEHLWLAGGDDASLIQLLRAGEDQPFAHYSVSSLVNQVDRNEARVIQPAPPADQFGNLTLFD